MGILDRIRGLFQKDDQQVLKELAGLMKLTFYRSQEDRPAFVTGSYCGRGVTFDLLNDKGFFDRWHPHSRIVISVERNVHDTYIVSYRGSFYSRKLAEVDVSHREFQERYILLSSNPDKAGRLLTSEIASWIVKLDMPFTITGGHATYHADRHFDDPKRIKYITDAIMFIVQRLERLK
jgi:hypothetical protein